MLRIPLAFLDNMALLVVRVNPVMLHENMKHSAMLHENLKHSCYNMKCKLGNVVSLSLHFQQKIHLSQLHAKHII